MSDVIVARPEVVHVLGVDGPVVWDHVDKTGTAIEWLVDGGEIPGFVCNLRQNLVDLVSVAALIDLWKGHHLVESVDPILSAIMAKLVAIGPSIRFRLRRIALWPPGASVVDAFKCILSDASSS